MGGDPIHVAQHGQGLRDVSREDLKIEPRNRLGHRPIDDVARIRGDDERGAGAWQPVLDDAECRLGPRFATLRAEGRALEVQDAVALGRTVASALTRPE